MARMAWCECSKSSSRRSSRVWGLLGVKSFAELDASYLYPDAPLMVPAGYDSVFPLMKEEY